MKKLLYTISIFCLASALYGQNANIVLSGAGVRLVSNGSPEIVLNNANLVNNGSAASVIPGNGTVRFTGTASNATIGGSAPTTFYNVRVDKTGNEVVLGTDATVTNQARLDNGNFYLQGNLLDLNNTGSLVGEVYPNGNRFYCLDGQPGQIRAERTLGVGANADIAGLGLDLNFTSGSPGSTVIIRGHDNQTSTAPPGGTSIGRYYDITPTVASGYTYQFVFRYHTQELLANHSGVNETNFLFYRSPSHAVNTGDWEQWGAPVVGIGTPGYPTVAWASHDPITNVVGLSGINTFSRWTVSNSIIEPLPIKLISFDAECEKDYVTLKWKTATEINNEKFIIHRSPDLQYWEEIATMAGAGNSNQELAYTAIDPRPLDGIGYYRLTQKDFDGTTEFFDAISIFCQGGKEGGNMSVYPNPSSDIFTVSIYSPSLVDAAELLFTDINGKTLMNKQIALVAGSNNFVFDRWLLGPGTYFIQLNSQIMGIRPVKLIVQ